MGTEHVLQNFGGFGRRRKCRVRLDEEFERVAQLFRAFAQAMEVVGPRVATEFAAELEDAFAAALQIACCAGADGERAPATQCGRARSAVEQLAQSGHQSRVTVGRNELAQCVVRRDALPLQCGLVAAKLFRHDRAKGSHVLLQSFDVHVEIAHRAERTREPAQVLVHASCRTQGQQRAEQSQRNAHSPRRDANLMHVFGRRRGAMLWLPFEQRSMFVLKPAIDERDHRRIRSQRRLGRSLGRARSAPGGCRRQRRRMRNRDDHYGKWACHERGPM